MGKIIDKVLKQVSFRRRHTVLAGKGNIRCAHPIYSGPSWEHFVVYTRANSVIRYGLSVRCEYVINHCHLRP